MNSHKIKTFLFLILTSLSIAFVFQNTTLVNVQLLFWTLTMSGALLFILLIVLGVVFGWLLRGYQLRRIINRKIAEVEASS